MKRNVRYFILSPLASVVAVGCISAANVGDPAGTAGGADTSAQGGAGNSVGGSTGTVVAGSTGGARVATGGGSAVSLFTGGTVGVGGASVTISGLGGASTIATGGASTTVSTTPAPANGLGVYVNGITGATGKIVFDIRIDNKTAQSVDTSGITLRYWYQDEGLGSSLTYNSDYVKIGYSVAATMSGKDGAAPSPSTGADHYIEMSFTGVLSAQGDTDKKDQLTLHVTAHSGSWGGNVDVTNDYSYNSAATGYDDKITLYSGGNLIWGTEPGSTTTPTGTGGSSSIGTATGGTTSASGGASSAGGASASGGDTSTGGAAETGGDPATGGASSGTGGASSTGGESSIGGESSTGGDSSASAT